MRPKPKRWFTYDRTKLPPTIGLDSLGDEYKASSSGYNLRSTVSGRGITKNRGDKSPTKNSGWIRLGLLDRDKSEPATANKKKATGVAKLAAQLAMYGNEISGKTRNSIVSFDKVEEDRRESINSLATLASARRVCIKMFFDISHSSGWRDGWYHSSTMRIDR